MKKVLFFAAVLGFAACSNNPTGAKTEAGDAQAVNTAAGDATFNVNTAASSLGWLGTKPTGQHSGTIALKSGSLQTKDGKLVGGSFVLDMATITVTDLKAGEGKEDLEDHLKGTGKEAESVDHFFNIKQYPEGKFDITAVKPATGDSSLIEGNLTLKDVTKNIGFKALVKVEGNKLTASAPQFLLDRTIWHINYASKKIFGNLKDKFVNDNFGISINLEATK